MSNFLLGHEQTHTNKRDHKNGNFSNRHDIPELITIQGSVRIMAGNDGVVDVSDRSDDVHPPTHRLRFGRHLAASAAAVAVGVPLWIVLWAILFTFGVEYHRVEMAVPWLTIFAIVWMAMPVIVSSVGIYFAIQAGRLGRQTVLPVCAGMANLLWLLLGLFLWFMVARGVHV